MKKRPNLTIVAVTARRLIRADFDARAATPGRVWCADRVPGSERQPDGVRAALALGGMAAGGRVLALVEGFWSQSVALPSSQTAGLSQQAVAQALQFEVEPFSGLSPAESAAGFRSAPGEGGAHVHWVVACRRSDLEAIREIVRQAGGRLAGVSHPGGVPAPLLEEQGAAAPWHRLEQWEHGLLLVRAPEGAAGTTLVQSLSPGQFEGMRLPAAERGERLLADGTPGEQPAGRVLKLGDERDLRVWLGAWARVLAAQPEGLALVALPPAAATLRGRIAAAVACELLALALCFAYGRWFAAHRRSLQQTLARQRTVVAEIARLERESAGGERSLAERRHAEEERAAADAVLAARRRAWPALLRALSQARPPDLVVRALREESGGVRIEGVGLRPAAADELAVRLSGALRGAPWAIEPPRKEADGKFADAGPWQFSLRAMLADSLAVAPALPPAEERP